MKFPTCLGLALALAAGAMAQVVLEDGNSRAVIDPTSNQPTFLRGMTAWEVDGENQLFNQWYWLRIGQGPERTIDTLSAPTVTRIADNIANIRYGNDALRIDITFTLIGGVAGSGTADISEVVRVTNLGRTNLDLHLFEYDDFDLGANANDDVAVALNSSTIRQSDALRRVTVGSVNIPSAWQIADVPTIFDMLNDNLPSNLNNTGSPSGPGDLAFAFQWDGVVAPGSSYIMSKNKLVETVPEPGTLVALGLGAVALLRRRRRIS